MTCSGTAAIAMLLGCSVCTLMPFAGAQENTTEYELKATYLRRVPSFVEWPISGNAQQVVTPGSIRLCVVGNYSFGPMLAQEAQRSAVGGKKMEVQWIRKGLELNGCQIIFVSGSERKRYVTILEAAKGINALTIGETDGFLQAGGMVQLNYEDAILKFVVNLSAARAARLKMDARLLAMAKRVI